MNWEKITFDEIRKFCLLPDSILNSTTIKKKTHQSIIQEYDVEKWGSLLELSQKLTFDSHELLNQQAYAGVGKRLCLLDGEFYSGSALSISCEYVSRTVSMLSDIYAEHNCNCIVELAVGYGRVLVPLIKAIGEENIEQVQAFDYTDSSLQILNNIWVDSCIPVHLGKIDLGGNLSDFNVLPDKGNLRPLVYSSQGIMYVPRLEQQFMDLMGSWPKGVFCFIEPSTSKLPDTDLKSLQDRYIEINDYNTNLAEFLSEQQQNKVISNFLQTSAVLSENVFCPLQRFLWKFFK